MPNIADECDIDIDLLARIYREYLEMPGLQLTVPQASRLWNLNRATSAQTLQHLVDASLLRRVGECYVLVDCGCAFAGIGSGAASTDDSAGRIGRLTLTIVPPSAGQSSISDPP
jgi:hypothetical protein